jgi:DDE superfamily endonuclease
LLLYKIVWRWNENEQGNDDTIFIGTVDGTHCRLCEPRLQPDCRWYSHKFNKPAVVYEIMLDLFESKIVWVNGPFKAGYNDKAVFKATNGLHTKIPQRNKVIADSGYKGLKGVSAPNEIDSAIVKKFKKNALARQEHINARIKSHKITDERFRHKLAKHKTIFEAVCAVVQYDMDNGNPLSKIKMS